MYNKINIIYKDYINISIVSRVQKYISFYIKKAILIKNIYDKHVKLWKCKNKM